MAPFKQTLACTQLALTLMQVVAAAVSPELDPRFNWHYQLGTVIKRIPRDLQPARYNITVYDIDGFDTGQNVVRAMTKRGLYPICYFSAGSSEDWRPDFDQFPEVALGEPLDGWAGERWLDIRNSKVREIMVSRIQMCKDKGFPAVEADNVDGYTQKSGFPLTAQDQIEFLTFLADSSHEKGLKIGLKNNVDQIPQLVSRFDFAINEQCWTYDECDTYTPFISMSKPVWNVEYGGSQSRFLNNICPKAASLGIKSVKQRLTLDKKVHIACPQDIVVV